MTLSISRKLLIFGLLLVGVSNCSHQPIKEEKKEEIKPIVKIPDTHFQMGPTLPQNNFFLDQTKEYGLEGVKAVHLNAVDVNHDGKSDLVILEDFYSVPKFYFFDNKKKKFILGKYPFDEIVRASYLVFADFDHDRILDVVVGSLNQKSEMTQYPVRIFKGEIIQGNLHYKEMQTPLNKILPTASVSLIDYDLDGELDLYFSNWFSYAKKNPAPIPDVLLKGKGKFQFENVSHLLKGEYDLNKSDKLFINSTPTFGATICDINQDGYPDILTSNSNGYFNKLWISHDAREFTNAGKESGYGADSEGTEEGRGGGNSFFSLCGDYNNDGFIDVVIGNLARVSDPIWVDRSAILTGSTKKFIPQFLRTDFFYENEKGNRSEGDRRGIWIDYNLDGKSDLLIDNSGFPPDSRLTFFSQTKDHAFEDKSITFGVNILNPSGTVTIDINGDGLMDFITGQTTLRTGETDNRIYLFTNKFKRDNRGSIRFHLQGIKSNEEGISSSVYLKTNKQKYFQNVQYSYGSLPSQNEEGIYFAFAHEMPEKVTVAWSLAIKDNLGRDIPLLKNYNLNKMNLKGIHSELNLCEDGRILPRSKNCY